MQKKSSEELGKLNSFDSNEKNEVYKKVGLGALKYFILKVEPKKTITFNPKDSIDFNGNTGPFIQYTYVRIQSILKKGENISLDKKVNITLSEKLKSLLKISLKYKDIIQQSAKEYNPSLIANYVYSLVKEYNSFYQNINILTAKTEDEKILGLKISAITGNIIKSSLDLLGIEVPKKM